MLSIKNLTLFGEHITMLKICTVYFEGLYHPNVVSNLYRSLKETNDEISTILRGETGKMGTTLTPSQIQYFLKKYY